jgi:hypothetical protein
MADGTLKVGTITTSSGSGTITLGQSGETISIPSGVTFSATAGTMSGQNYPGFHAFLSSGQTLSDGTETKLQINSEVYDSDSDYDNSTNYRFTPSIAGKYMVYGAAILSSGASANNLESELYIKKNGSTVGKSSDNFNSNYANVNTQTLQIVIDMNGSSDYVELYGLCNTVNSGDATAFGDSTQQRTYFGAYRIGA